MNIDVTIDWSLAASILVALLVFQVIKELYRWILWDARRGHIGIAATSICNDLKNIRNSIIDLKA